MSLDKIQQLVGSLAKTVENNERLATPILSAKLAKCVELYPYDQTIGTMSVVIEKLAQNDKLFIKKADFKKLYTKMYSCNTKFAELFAEELGTIDSLKPSVKMDRSNEVNIVPEYQPEDTVLTNALASAFDSDVAFVPYSQVLAKTALKSVNSTLDSWNLAPKKLSVANGSDKFLIIKADYDSPKGITSIFVPVEIQNNKLSEASLFVCNEGPTDLDHGNLKGFLKSRAGTKLTITADIILDALTKASSSKREITQAEIALTKLNATRQGKSDFFAGSIVGQKLASEVVEDVQLAKSDEFTSFEDTFTSPQGVANFTLGEVNVKNAKDSLLRDLAGFGYKNVQMTVVGSDKSTVRFGVSLAGGKAAFTVPVKINDGKVSKASVILCNGSLNSFDKESINNLLVNNQTDYKVAAAASPQFGMHVGDLVSNIRSAVKEGNHAKAEDALNVLASSGDPVAYATGFSIYMGSLSGKVATASVSEEEHKCNFIQKTANSQHPICGHTGLPLHKVYTDSHGACRPLYRRAMDESYEGGYFMTAKIFG